MGLRGCGRGFGALLGGRRNCRAHEHYVASSMRYQEMRTLILSAVRYTILQMISYRHYSFHAMLQERKKALIS